MTTQDVSPARKQEEVPASMMQQLQQQQELDKVQIPAYSPVDGSTVCVAGPNSAPESEVADGNGSSMARTFLPPSPALAPEYPTAEQEKDDLFRVLNSAAGVHATPPSPQFSPPVDGTPGHATESLLSRGLQVPTSRRLVSSGFPYPDVLANYRVNSADWTSFTSNITKAASMKSSDWSLALGGGVGTCLVSGLLIGWWGVIPACFVGRSIRRKRETQHLTKARNMGDLEDKLLIWNKDYFAPRGLLIRMDLPGESYDIGKMDVYRPSNTASAKVKQRWSSFHGRNISQADNDANEVRTLDEEKMEVLKKAKKDESRLKMSAIKKCRIVILPLHHSASTSLPGASMCTVSATASTASLANLDKQRQGDDLFASSV